MSCLSTSAMASSTQWHFKYMYNSTDTWSLHSSDITWFLSLSVPVFLGSSWSLILLKLQISTLKSTLQSLTSLSERGHPFFFFCYIALLRLLRKLILDILLGYWFIFCVPWKENSRGTEVPTFLFLDILTFYKRVLVNLFKIVTWIGISQSVFHEIIEC